MSFSLIQQQSPICLVCINSTACEIVVKVVQQYNNNDTDTAEEKTIFYFIRQIRFP